MMPSQPAIQKAPNDASAGVELERGPPENSAVVGMHVKGKV